MPPGWGTKEKQHTEGRDAGADFAAPQEKKGFLAGLKERFNRGSRDGAGEWREGLPGRERNGLAGMHNKADESLKNEIKEKTSDNIMQFPIDMSKVTSIDEYGPREKMKIGDKTTKPLHEGMDFAAPEGTPVFAAIDGWVREISFNESSYGNYIVIGNDKGWTGTLTYYGHLKEAPSLVLGEPVKQGQQIGLVGSTGLSSGPHVHFEVRTNYGHTKHDPRDFYHFEKKEYVYEKNANRFVFKFVDVFFTVVSVPARKTRYYRLYAVRPAKRHNSSVK